MVGCSTRIVVTDWYFGGSTQLAPHTTAQPRNNGIRNCRWRRRTTPRYCRMSRPSDFSSRSSTIKLSSQNFQPELSPQRAGKLIRHGNEFAVRVRRGGDRGHVEALMNPRIAKLQVQMLSHLLLQRGGAGNDVPIRAGARNLRQAAHHRAVAVSC